MLSDDQIVEILTGYGIEIARRTVAKYRESLNIPLQRPTPPDQSGELGTVPTRRSHLVEIAR